MEPQVRPSVHSLEELERRHAEARHLWLEFLRVPAMSVGLYVLPTGAEDPQTPHHEDEVYVVLRGRATLRIHSDDRPAEPGTVAFVPREVPHRFHSVRERLVALVVFAPAETLDSASPPEERPQADLPGARTPGARSSDARESGGGFRAPEGSDTADDLGG